MAAPWQRPIVLCPLQFERTILKRTGLSGRFDVQCCGPGAAAIVHWAQSHEGITQPVILAGVAGSISTRFKAGQAGVITEVVDEHARERWRPTLAMAPPLVDGAPDLTPCAITSVAVIAATLATRQQLHAHTGADLVDLESVAFAAAATRAGWKWAVVRGVSDDLETGLPVPAADWIDNSGRTRLGRVVGSICRHPRLVYELFGLHRRAKVGLRVAGTLILASANASAVI